MGRATIEDMLHHTDEEAALHWHLTANHYPPIHECFVPIAKQVIERAATAVEDPKVWAEAITMPNGKTMRVGEICSALHLGQFVEARLERERTSHE